MFRVSAEGGDAFNATSVESSTATLFSETQRLSVLTFMASPVSTAGGEEIFRSKFFQLTQNKYSKKYPKDKKVHKVQKG